METPALRLPTVNVGERQRGRERARNIIDVEPRAEAILAAVARGISPEFRATLEGMENPYGDGTAGKRIAEILSTVELGEKLLHKRAVAVTPRTPSPSSAL
jgi:UDP-N-acetylglucosamine 2-epimerase